MKNRLWLAGAGVLVAVAFALFVYPAPLRTVTSHFAGQCRALEITADAGDIALDPTRGIAYVSYLDRTGPAATKHRSGTVMLVDLNAEMPRVRAALVADPPEFQPGASSVFVSPDGVRRLFVIDRGPTAVSTRADDSSSTTAASPTATGEHASTPAMVQIFEQGSTGAFALVKSVRDPLLSNAMAIVAVGAEQFYFTRDADASSGAPGLRALLFRPSHSSVMYYDGTRIVPVATGLKLARGLTRSSDGSLIYVSEMTGKRLRLYERNETTGALRAREAVSLDSAPAGISTDGGGTIWIAAQPRLMALLFKTFHASTRPPTQILSFSPTRSKDAQVSPIYTNNGIEVSAASAVAAHGKRLLIGAADHHQLLLCEAQ